MKNEMMTKIGDQENEVKGELFVGNGENVTIGTR